MKKLVGILPLMALVLGFTAALASQPNADVTTTKKALNSANQWIDITGQVQGTDYACDVQQDRVCTRLFDAQGSPIPQSDVSGRYRAL